MSKKDFKTILEILSKFNFSYQFSKVEYFIDKDTKKEFPESGLTVNYNDNKGSFKIMVSTFNDAEKAQLFTALEKGKGSIPNELRPSNLPAVIKKEYKLTKGMKYFSKETLQEITGEINLTDPNTIACNVVAVDSLPDFVFLKHPPLTKGSCGASILYRGFAFNGITPHWKENGGDPFSPLIEKIKEVGQEKMHSMMDGILKDKKLKAPAKAPAPAPVKVEHLNKDTVKKVVKEMIEKIKGTDPVVFDSWGAEKFSHKWDGKNSVSVQFTVDGFLHSGLVAVTKDQSTGLYTISLLEGEKPFTLKHTVNKVTGDKVSANIDFMVECDTTQEEYEELFVLMYGEEAMEEIKQPEQITEPVKPAKTKKKAA